MFWVTVFYKYLHTAGMMESLKECHSCEAKNQCAKLSGHCLLSVIPGEDRQNAQWSRKKEEKSSSQPASQGASEPGREKSAKSFFDTLWCICWKISIVQWMFHVLGKLNDNSIDSPLVILVSARPASTACLSLMATFVVDCRVKYETHSIH